MIEIDGSLGEGGGQILRTALALSLTTGQPFEITRIRAGRPRPGLLRQHLTAVEAARTIGRARVEGAELGSQRLVFEPVTVRAGDYSFAIGSAGSASLVVQTILPPLLRANGPTSLTVSGGTHNPSSPPFEFLAYGFLPLVSRMGPEVNGILHRPGFYPAGGGSLTIRILPSKRLNGIELASRGEIIGIEAEATVAGLPRHIAERELARASEILDLPEQARRVRVFPDEMGPGNVLTILVRSSNVTEVFTGFGRKGVPAEAVGRETAEEARRYIEADVAVAEHTADQVLLPMVLAGSGSITTLPLSRHATTNIHVIRRFVPTPVAAHPLGENRCLVRVGSPGPLGG